MISIPTRESRLWTAQYDSDIFGSVVNGRNLDFNEPGYLKLARKAMALYTSDTDADLGRIVAITGTSSVYYFVTDDHVFSLTPTSIALTFAELTATGMPALGLGSDATVFNGVLHVSGTSKIASFSSSWTDRVTGLSSSYVHPLCVDPRRLEIAVGDGNTVKTYNTAYSLQNTLTIRSEYVVSSIRYQSGNYYIGTRNTSGGDAPVYVWNGGGTSATSYPSGSSWVYSITEFNPAVVILTNRGQLKMWNGAGFSELENFPVYSTSFSWTESTGNDAPGKCLNRGMCTMGDRIYINIQGDTELSSGEYPGPGLENQPGGVWVYEKAVGLYHKAGYVTERFKTVTISSLNSSVFTMPSAHGLETGDAVWAASVTNIPALSNGQTYFAIVESTTSFKLALSASDAKAGRFLLCTGTISSDTLSYDDLTSVGNTFNLRPGAIAGISQAQPNQFFASEVFFGGGSQDIDGNNVFAAMSLGMGRNVGWFVTPKIQATSVTNVIDRVIAYLSNIYLDTDKILTKWRTSSQFGLPTPVAKLTNGLATWVDSTSFTIDTRYKDVKSAEVGDEVYFIEGGGAGYTAHITAINDNTSTYSYTIDETIPTVVAGDLSDVFINNWKKTESNITNSAESLLKGYVESKIEKTGSWHQFKFELRGFLTTVNLLDFTNKEAKK